VILTPAPGRVLAEDRRPSPGTAPR